ncbi:MAG: hypothetical protein GX621_19215 [Pirellulaceae bacterium]|nr:hypothetical protein [Pirellulaceae bacterium]
MSRRVFFVHPCPTCGRRLHIRVEYLGKKVVCPHCGARLDAYDTTAGDFPMADSAGALMKRVEELLETTPDQTPEYARLAHPR